MPKVGERVARVDTIRVLVLNADGKASFQSPPHTLDALQGLVGGYLEPVGMAEPWRSRHMMALVNEDGRRLQLHLNPFSRTLLRDPFGLRLIVGNALIVRTKDDEFDSLNDADVSALRLQLSNDGVAIAS